MKNIKDIFKIISLPVIFASMCCLSPLLIFVFGLGSLAFVSSLADTLYGDYKWVFRGVGLGLLVISLIIYFRSKGICTLDKVKRERNRIINITIITLVSSVFAYMFFLYVVVHYAGVFLNIWE